MENFRLSNLIKKYLSGRASEDETAQLESWYGDLNEDDSPMPKQRLSSAMHRLDQRHRAFIEEIVSTKRKQNRRYISIAASVLLLLGGFLTFWALKHNEISGRLQQAERFANITPGTDQAYLTLADGKVISLNEIKNDTEIIQGTIKIRKSKDGEILYEPLLVQESETDTGFNTIHTPAGGQFTIVLPDGSKVWLNAASTLKYPTKFGAERVVELQGEAYFEINSMGAPGSLAPFIVETQYQDITVLGTHFNVNSYPDQHFSQTSLIEGRVSVFHKELAETTTLSPNQQATTTPESQSIETINPEAVMAWKNGYFFFDDEPLEDIMKKLARWYNIEVSYQGVPSTEEYGGIISRSEKISVILEMLAEAGSVNFEIEGRRVKVMP